MSARNDLVAAVATAVLSAAALSFASGCSGPPASVRLQISSSPNFSADAIALTVFDRNGRVIDGAALGGSAKLPGDVLVLLGAGAGEARALAIATASGARVGIAVGRVPVVPGRESSLGLQLSANAMPDSDGDGVPDIIDNCPVTPNPAQTSSDGDVTGDDCRPTGGGHDGGVVGSNPGADLGSGGGGGSDGGVVVPAGCGNGTLDTGEQCDSGSGNSDDPASASTCTTMCRVRAPCGTISGAAGAKVDAATGHCYVAWPGPINWASAQRDCQSRGGQLAVITSAAENTFIQTLGGLSQMWIGLEILHGATDTLKWVDGEPATFTAFAPNEPNNGANNGNRNEDCGARTSTGWADMPCGFPETGTLPASVGFSLGFICENSCGNGVVDPGEECDGGAACTATCRTKRACTESNGYVSPINGHCYFAINNSVDYPTALNNSCPATTHLATLGDISETEAGQLAMGAVTDAWIALRAGSSVGNYSWQAPSFEGFNSRRYHGFSGVEPNETGTPNCGRLVAGVGWKDRLCTDVFGTLCERD
ncbi:MAG: Cell surface protein [Myxococcales bacterium]|nr:Cell surface protein [Myxococcales bacterium]